MKNVFLIALLAIIGINSATAQKATRTKHYNTESGLALQGYDPVAYFTQNKAVQGSKQFAANADGVTYYLSSAANKALFVKEYKKYEPQYGGWCAYAMGAMNEKVEIDPKTFKVKNGKLYLFYHSWTNNTLPKWNEMEGTLLPNADKNWTAVFR